MTTINAAVSKTESVFDTLVLPGLSLAAGYFAGPTLFTVLEEKVAAIDANGDGTSDLDHAFGANYNGSRIIAGLIVGVVGFSVHRMGSVLKYIGLFLVGAAIGMLISGFKLMG